MQPYANEAEFQTEFITHIKRKGGVGFKFSDSDMRLKMCDCVTTYKGETCWIELKFRNDRHTPTYQVTQQNSCDRVWKAGGKYFFIEYDARNRTMKVIHGFVPDYYAKTDAEIFAMLGVDDLYL